MLIIYMRLCIKKKHDDHFQGSHTVETKCKGFPVTLQSSFNNDHIFPSTIFYRKSLLPLALELKYLHNLFPAVHPLKYDFVCREVPIAT